MGNPYKPLEIYEINIPQEIGHLPYKFWTMICADGTRQVAWMPDNNDSIRPQSREDGSIITLRNITDQDVEKTLREIVKVASTLPNLSDKTIDQIINKNHSMIRNIRKDLKSYR